MDQPLVPPSRKEFMVQFYSQTVDVLSDLRRFVYRCVSRKLANVRDRADGWPRPLAKPNERAARE